VELESAGSEVLFVGTPEGPEARLVPLAGIEYRSLRAKGFDRGALLSIVPALLTLAVSTIRAARLIRSHEIDVVVGFGGYVSLPVGLGAVITRRPLVLHEQNSVPGLANRVLSRWARVLALTYPLGPGRISSDVRVVITGNPVRQDVLVSDPDLGRKSLGLRHDSLVLLVFGGSRGARHINESVLGIVPRLAESPGLEVVHVAGRVEEAAVHAALESVAPGFRDSYHVVGYLDDMGSALAAADLVIARAGATSIAEITAMGIPSVLVPYPYATDDHQTSNARTVSDAGGAVVVADADLDSPGFGDVVLGLLHDEARRRSMSEAAMSLARRDAAASVAALIDKAAGL